MNVLDQLVAETHGLYQGDSIRVLKGLPDASIHFTITSVPFSTLYVYSASEADLGNNANDAEFQAHLGYIIPELYRVTIPGRLCAIHCKQLVNYKGRDGMAGLRDFRGELIRAFIARGWAFHSEVTIWTDPVLEMQRTKAHGLLYKQLRADSTFSRQGMPEYLLLFRRWPENEHEESLIQPVTHTREDFPLEVWQRYASPVWMDISRTDVLNIQAAREDKDSKHICPLQLGIIRRALDLWTNPQDIVLDPFSGIGSSGYVAVAMQRRYIGVELKEQYHLQACANLQRALDERRQLGLFDGQSEGTV